MKRLLALAVLLPLPLTAQVYGTAGQNWSGTYGFPSVSDRSLVLQQAQIIRDAEREPDQGPQTVYYVKNDNRANYVEVDTNGDVTTDFQIGDEIGQQTYAVGSLNTGSTSITVDGSDNTINADNTAENTGCINGSILSATLASALEGGSATTDGAEATGPAAPMSALELADALAAAGSCD